MTNVQCTYCSCPAVYAAPRKLPPLCQMHYIRLRKYGDPNVVHKRGPRPRDWRDVFLGELQSGRSVAAARDTAGISGAQLYARRQQDQVFARLWDLHECIARCDRQQRSIHKLRAELDHEETKLIADRDKARKALEQLQESEVSA